MSADTVERAEMTACPGPGCERAYVVQQDGWWLLDRETFEVLGDEPTEACDCGTNLAVLTPASQDDVAEDAPDWASRPPELAEPLQLELEIQEGAKLVEQAGVRLARAIKRWGAVEAAWKVAHAQEVLKVHHKYRRNEERTPAKDILDAMAFDALGVGLYNSRLSWQAEVEALEAFIGTVSQAITARQTLLNRAGGRNPQSGRTQ